MSDSFQTIGFEYGLKENESHKQIYNKISRILLAPQFNCNLVIFPEYCWGRTPINQQQLTSWAKTLVEEHSNLVLGTGIIKENNAQYNAIIIVDRQNNVHFIPKSFPLKYEQSYGITAPTSEDKIFSPNVLELDKINVGFLVCADLWRADFVKNIVMQGAEIIICPAMTSTDVGYTNYAKFQWYTLGITRSREFVVPIVVVDNPIEQNQQVTGKATFSCDPSIKRKNMNLFDFLCLPKHRILVSRFDFNRIAQYRSYRISQNIIT